MADATLVSGTIWVPFKLHDHHMEIYGSSERDQKWVVVNLENVTNNPHAMIVIWYDTKTSSCYARKKNDSVIAVHTKIGCKIEDGHIFHLKDNTGYTYLKDGNGDTYFKQQDGYFHLRENGNTYKRDDDGYMYMTTGDEIVNLRNGDEIQITKGKINLKFIISWCEEQNVTKGNNELSTATYWTEKLKHHQESLRDDQVDTCWNVQDHTDNIEPGRWHGCQINQNPAKLKNTTLYSTVVRTRNKQLTSSQGKPSTKNMSVVSATSISGDRNVITRQPGMDHKGSDKRLPMNVPNQVEFFNKLDHGKRGKEQPVGFYKRNNPANFNTNKNVTGPFVGQTSCIPRQNPSQGVPIKGIANMGLTCYASGIIQILAQTDLFLKNVRSNDKHRMPLAYSLSRVLLEINKPSNQTVVERKNIQKVFEIIEQDPSFVSRSSNDCLEFLMYIFERLNGESKDNISMFQIKLQNVIHASPCGHFELCDIQLSYHLLIPLYSETHDFQPSVRYGLRKLLQEGETFSGHELPCRRCYEEKTSKNDTSHKSLSIIHAPEVLILQIGRVQPLQYSKRLYKQDAFIQYDRQLEIAEEHWGPDGKPDNIQRFYQLYGVVSHYGDVQFGHYACYVKKTHSSQWFYCNDSNVNLIDEEKVFKNSDAFLLFYEKIRTA
ncbi:uncharacterized protein LOC134721464 [Mytilus trossulus]|uniref:uncharacterized protein LOC134721464 n=1 Tax=Mytilus trossulus TaxID=6551 RepID=UPI0030060582